VFSDLQVNYESTAAAAINQSKVFYFIRLGEMLIPAP
jgi:hypothetical protein